LPAWIEAAYLRAYGGPPAGSGKFALVAVITVVSPVILVSFIGVLVLAGYLWRQFPSVRSRTAVWFALLVGGFIPWPPPEQPGITPRPVSNSLNVAGFLLSFIAALVWVIWPGGRRSEGSREQLPKADGT
jgi:hypothetical protein